MTTNCNLLLRGFVGLLLAGSLGACSSDSGDETTDTPVPVSVNLSENSYLELTWTPDTTNPNLSLYLPLNLNTGTECEFRPTGGFSAVYNQSLVTGLSGTRYELFSRTTSGAERIRLTRDLPDGTYYLYYNVEFPLNGVVPAPPYGWTINYYQGPDTLLNTFTGTQTQVANSVCDPYYNMGIAMTKIGANVTFATFPAPPAPAQPDTLAFTQSASFSFTLSDSSRIALDEPTPDDNYDINWTLTRGVDADLCNCNATCLAQFTLATLGTLGTNGAFYNFTPQRVASRRSRKYILFPSQLPDGDYFVYFAGASTFVKPFVLEGMSDQTTVVNRLAGTWNLPGRCLAENSVYYRTRIKITKSGTTATVSRF